MNTGGQLADDETSIKGQWWIARVVDNDDPMQLERVRIRVTDLFRDIEDADLPWASQFDLSTTYPTGTTGSVSVPSIGALVWVQFMDESPYNPVYMGGVSVTSSKIDELLALDYPHTTGSVDRSGNRYIVNTKKDHVEFIHVSGTTILIDGHGHISINVADGAVGGDATSVSGAGIIINVTGNVGINCTGDAEVNAQGKADIRAGGNATVHAGGTLDMVGSTINLNSGPATAPSATTPATPRTRPSEPGFNGQTSF